MKVEIGLLHDLGYATTVATEPLTADDWEIIVSRISHLIFLFPEKYGRASPSQWDKKQNK